MTHSELQIIDPARRPQSPAASGSRRLKILVIHEATTLESSRHLVAWISSSSTNENHVCFLCGFTVSWGSSYCSSCGQGKLALAILIPHFPSIQNCTLRGNRDWFEFAVSIWFWWDSCEPPYFWGLKLLQYSVAITSKVVWNFEIKQISEIFGKNIWAWRLPFAGKLSL